MRKTQDRTSLMSITIEIRRVCKENNENFRGREMVLNGVLPYTKADAQFLSKASKRH